MAKPILVVDASREFGILIRQSLEEEGDYRVKLVHSGQQAIEAASAQNFDIALIDFSLPDVPGPELVRQLASLDSTLSIVAIPAAGSADQLTDIPVAGVLAKPFYLPDLAKLLERTLKKQSLSPNWIQWEQPETKPPSTPETRSQATEVAEVNQTAPTEPVEAIGPESAPPQAALQQWLERNSARAAALWRDDRILIRAGLSADQVRALHSTLMGLREHIARRRAVTQYMKLPDVEGDLLMFASPWRQQLTLVTVFPADRPFRQVRRTTQNLAQYLQAFSVEEGSGLAPAEPTQVETEPGAVEEAANLPDDWVPDHEFNPAQRAMLDELAALEPPPPDPAPSTAPQKDSLELPADWIPSNQRSQAVLAMIEGSETSQATKPTPTEASSPADGLTYNLALIPRFPDHQISATLAQTLEEWIQRICLAWDWRSDQIDIQPNYVFIRLELNPESAPAQAVQQLKADLARKILSEQISWNASLPSGRFFAHKHLLTSGAPPDESQIRQFVKQVRRAQGFGS